VRIRQVERVTMKKKEQQFHFGKCERDDEKKNGNSILKQGNWKILAERTSKFCQIIKK